LTTEVVDDALRFDSFPWKEFIYTILLFNIDETTFLLQVL
jgi:hypothetical protein